MRVAPLKRIGSGPVARLRLSPTTTLNTVNASANSPKSSSLTERATTTDSAALVSDESP